MRGRCQLSFINMKYPTKITIDVLASCQCVVIDLSTVGRIEVVLDDLSGESSKQ